MARFLFISAAFVLAGGFACWLLSYWFGHSNPSTAGSFGCGLGLGLGGIYYTKTKKSLRSV